MFVLSSSLQWHRQAIVEFKRRHVVKKAKNFFGSGDIHVCCWLLISMLWYTNLHACMHPSIYTYIHIYIYILTCIHTGRPTDRQTDKGTERQTVGRTERQRDRKANGHTYRLSNSLNARELTPEKKSGRADEIDERDREMAKEIGVGVGVGDDIPE